MSQAKQTSLCLVMMVRHALWKKACFKETKIRDYDKHRGHDKHRRILFVIPIRGGYTSRVSGKTGNDGKDVYEVVPKRDQVAAEKEEMLIRHKEFEFLLTETAGKDPTYVALVNMEKDRIIAKYNLPPRQE